MPSEIFVQGWCTLKISPQQAASSRIGCKNPLTPSLLPCNKSILGVPVQTSLPAPLSPLTRSSSRTQNLTSQAPEGSRGRPRCVSSQLRGTAAAGCPAARLQGEAEPDAGWKLKGEERGHTLPTWSLLPRRVVPVLHPNPARRGLRPFARAGSRWGSSRQVSSGLGMQQPHAATPNPNSAQPCWG